MPRMTVKLLILDEQDRVLLIRSVDRVTGGHCWYPVGGGVEDGETLQDAARREAYEEVGLSTLPLGTHVWTRDHVYEHDGRAVDVHEDWFLHRVTHFEPRPAALSERESATIRGFDWWTCEGLQSTSEVVFPPGLGDLIEDLLVSGAPDSPIDISH